MRKRVVERLDDLIEVATTLFITKGYRRTQMTDVTQAMGLSPGAIYRYVESKEALFDLVVRAAASTDLGREDLSFPLPTPPPGAALAFLREVVGRESRLPSLETALTQPSVGDPQAELAEIVRDLNRVLTRHRRGIKLLERSALDWPELAAFWFGSVRAAVLDQIARYLELRIAHHQLRPVPDAAASARLIVETVTFFAIHRHDDPYPTPMDERLAEATVVDALTHAYGRG